MEDANSQHVPVVVLVHVGACTKTCGIAQSRAKAMMAKNNEDDLTTIAALLTVSS